ncbi:MAG: sugar transferase [Bacteroidota bacterium]|nr:sugar transferase [Bacteroidota bacterium]
MLKDIITDVAGKQVYEFVSKYVDVENNTTQVLMTSTKFNVDKLENNKFNNIVNLKKINDVIRINKFIKAINKKLPLDGLYIGCVETYLLRRIRILKKYPPVLNVLYFWFDFIFKRVFPKLPITKKIYFFITLGRNRAISKVETYGRLYSCGFKIIDETVINHLQYFVVQKVKESPIKVYPSYGFFFGMRRVGKNGKLITVYKIRTMRPYSEYLQEYIYEKNKLQEGGKIKNDIRITRWGKFLRKFWIDEIPMIYNILKGDLKLVGVRPLSQHFLSLYTHELREKRMKFKPGLIPPFYKDMPKTLEEIMESESKYLDAYEKSPFITDIKYFFAIFYNIVIKKARSH